MPEAARGEDPALRAGGWRVVTTVGAVGLVVAGLAQQLAVVGGWVRTLVSEDQALLWAAARSWGELRPQQPHFWGQTYAVTVEAIPAELFRRLGLGYPTGLPLGVMLINLAVWWVLAGAAWWRGRRLAALVALAAPLVLSTEYAVMVAVYNTAFGRLLGAIAIAIVVVAPGRERALPVLVTVGGLAVLVDASAALLVAPALVCAAVELPPTDRAGRRRRGALVLAGLAPPAVWGVATWWWYREHPDHDLHPSAALDPAWEVLTDNVTNPTRHAEVLVPELARWPFVVVLVVAGIVAVGLRRGARAFPPTATALVVVVVLLLAIPRSRDGLPTVYYSASRTVLGLPPALWFVGYVATSGEAHRTRPTRFAPAGVASVVLLAIVLGSLGVRVATWSSRYEALGAEARLIPNYPVTSTADLIAECLRHGDVAAARGADVVLYDLRTAAYACAGVLGDDVVTVYPPYERRAWVLHALDEVGPERMLVVGPTPLDCSTAGLACEQLAPELVVVDLGDGTPLDAVRALGVTVRPYG